jgi:hypothetical protein
MEVTQLQCGSAARRIITDAQEEPLRHQEEPLPHQRRTLAAPKKNSGGTVEEWRFSAA